MEQRELTLGFPASRNGAVRRGGAFGNSLFAALILGSVLAAPALCRAEEGAPSVFGYALSGFGTGIATGFAAGYLATGPNWESDEWKTVLWGGGVGALTGLGIGVVLGVVDAGTANGGGRGMGFYVMRDANLGFIAGALAGGVVGALYWAGGGTSKDLLIGTSWGTVIGAGSGLILGVVEGALRGPDTAEQSSASRLRLDVGVLPSASGAPLPYPNLSGRF